MNTNGHEFFVGSTEYMEQTESHAAVALHAKRLYLL